MSISHCLSHVLNMIKDKHDVIGVETNYMLQCSIINYMNDLRLSYTIDTKTDKEAYTITIKTKYTEAIVDVVSDITEVPAYFYIECGKMNKTFKYSDGLSKVLDYIDSIIDYYNN